MLNKFISFYIENLKIIFLIIIISIIITITTDKIYKKSKLIKCEIQNLPALKLNKIIPSEQILKLLNPGKIRVSQEGVIDQPSKSAMELISVSIFENLIDEIRTHDYRNNYLKKNPQILAIEIKSNNTDWAQISFYLDINENLNPSNLLFDYMEVSNLETKKLVRNIIKKSDALNEIDYLFNFNSIKVSIEKPLNSFYIFVISFLILNYFYFLIFYFKNSRLKLKI